MKHFSISVIVFLFLAIRLFQVRSELKECKQVIDAQSKDKCQPELQQSQSKRTCIHSISELPYPPPKEFRQYHRCNIEKVPQISGMLETAQYLLWTRRSFVRFGDMDVELIMNNQFNMHNPSLQKLALALKTVLQTDDQRIIVGLPDTFSGYTDMHKGYIDHYFDWDHVRKWLLLNINLNKQYLQSTISSLYIQSLRSYCLLVPEIYSTLRTIWKDKDIVILRGNNTQKYKYDVYDTAKSQKIYYAPRYNAWNSYHELRELMLQEDPSKLFILSCGPACKVLTYDLVKTGRYVLDLGHLAKDYDWYKCNRTQGDFWGD